MIREIMRDEAFLAHTAEPATPEDLPIAQDLLDTLGANKERCVGMAANMIGVHKRIMNTPGMIRSRRKIETVIGNARIVQQIRETDGLIVVSPNYLSEMTASFRDSMSALCSRA